MNAKRCFQMSIDLELKWKCQDLCNRCSLQSGKGKRQPVGWILKRRVDSWIWISWEEEKWEKFQLIENQSTSICFN